LVRETGQDESMPETTATRLLRLLPLLTARPEWRGEELAEALGVTTRTVRRDIGRLRELGYPVTATSGRHGSYALRPGNGLPPLLLDDDSAVAVAIGLRVVAARGLADAAARAAAAIDQVLPARLRRRVDAVLEATVPLPSPAFSHNTLEYVAQACQSAERLRFVYRDSSGSESRRHVEPYRLVATNSRWYLVARDVAKGEWRSFRLDRISEALGTGVRSRPSDPPDAARFVSEGVSVGPYRWRARVLLDAPAEVVTSRVPATVAVVEAVDERHCLLMAGSDHLDAIALHLAELDIAFTPLDPPELRVRCAVLAARLQAAATARPGELSGRLLLALRPHAHAALHSRRSLSAMAWYRALSTARRPAPHRTPQAARPYPHGDPHPPGGTLLFLGQCVRNQYGAFQSGWSPKARSGA
jgi:predicted DNA-binding transcriptional regulator YafY